MDVGPTILDLAGVKAKWMEAETLMPALEGEALKVGPTSLQSMAGTSLYTIDFVTMIRTKDWKLVQFLDRSDGQFFDLVNDPEEINLWDDPEHARRKTSLSE